MLAGWFGLAEINKRTGYRRKFTKDSKNSNFILVSGGMLQLARGLERTTARMHVHRADVRINSWHLVTTVRAAEDSMHQCN